VARTRAIIASTDPEAYASCCEAIAAMDLREDVRGIQAPALVISGSDDPAAPPEAGALIAERIPGASFEVVPNARHLVSLQRPEIVTPLILDHLDHLDPHSEDTR
jgi:pimeloyl-ACP methyl ester carboxylesterase